jgi:hypothetical protein
MSAAAATSQPRHAFARLADASVSAGASHSHERGPPSTNGVEATSVIPRDTAVSLYAVCLVVESAW